MGLKDCARFLSVHFCLTIRFRPLTTLDVNSFELENREIAELIGLELARLIVDTCYPELLREREETERVIERQSRKSPYRR